MPTITETPAVWSNKISTLYNKHHKDAPEGAIYIGRGSPYGNPFVIGTHGTRDQVCDKYQKMFDANYMLQSKVKAHLKGKHLVCFCAPARCHGETFLKFLEGK